MKNLLIVILMIMFFGSIYGAMKAIADSDRDYHDKNKIIRWMESRGGWWNDFANERLDKGSSFFRGIWHCAEWFREFTFYGCAFVCLCFRPKKGEIVIIGLSMIVSFWLSGQVFYWLYHFGIIIN
jgi:hypothetical protein